MILQKEREGNDELTGRKRKECQLKGRKLKE
jgi:hypothetical protein